MEDDDFSPMNMLMDCYNKNRSLYMSFLSFIVDMNVVLAKKIFQTIDFRVARCLDNTTFSLEDFETVLAFDVALDSDIFRDKRYPILYNIFSTAIIPVETIDKMKKIVLAYGPDFMSWTSNHSVPSSSTNVNVYLENGYIMHTQKSCKVEETLYFLINSCPLALKQLVKRKSGNVNAFTIVLERCDSETDPRHQMIVHNVFQYVDRADLHTIYNSKGQTLEDLVGASGNSLVLGYIEKKFDISIQNTSEV